MFFHPPPKPKDAPLSLKDQTTMYKQRFDMFGTVDYFPQSLPITHGRARLYLLEDNDAVIKMVIKERSPALRHVARTHRVYLDGFLKGLIGTPLYTLSLLTPKNNSPTYTLRDPSSQKRGIC